MKATQDPAELAAADLNKILERMEVPLKVINNSTQGKHVVATADLNEGTELWEEVPIVAWPSQRLVDLASDVDHHNNDNKSDEETKEKHKGKSLYYCFYCLKCVYDFNSPEGVVLPDTWIKVDHPTTNNNNTNNNNESDKSNSSTSVSESYFCSEDCYQKGNTMCSLLSPCLEKLHQFNRQELQTSNNNTNNTNTKKNTTKSCDLGSSGCSIITIEALARCMVLLITKLGASIQRYGLSYDLLQADFESSSSSSTSDNNNNKVTDNLLQQLFTQVSAPFNRLISTPDGTEFIGIHFHQWIEQLQVNLYPICYRYLLKQSGGSDNGENNVNMCALLTREGDKNRKEGENNKEQKEKEDNNNTNNDNNNTITPSSTTATTVVQLPPPSNWLEALLFAVFQSDTISTLMGELVLNAHAVNDFSLCFAYHMQPQQKENKEKDNNDNTNNTNNDNDNEKEEVTRTTAAPLFVKGAAVYSVLSALNHSCEPNVVVEHPSNDDSNNNNTHEIVLRTTRAVKKDEEICITYIPLDTEETVEDDEGNSNNNNNNNTSNSVAERRALLKGYMFECQCSRCRRESAEGK